MSKKEKKRRNKSMKKHRHLPADLVKLMAAENQSEEMKATAVIHMRKAKKASRK